MGETDEVDFEGMVKSFFLQGDALEQSEMQKWENYKIYEETLQVYQEMKKVFEILEMEKEISFGNLTKKLSIKNSLTKLQDVSNQQLQSLHEETLNLYETMSKESDDFNFNWVNSAMNKIENLESEFDKSTISKVKIDCEKKINLLRDATKNKRTKYNELEKQQIENGYSQSVNVLQQILKDDASVNKIKEIESKIDEIKQQLLLHNKNIEFLKERNKNSKIPYLRKILKLKFIFSLIQCRIIKCILCCIHTGVRTSKSVFAIKCNLFPKGSFTFSQNSTQFLTGFRGLILLFFQKLNDFNENLIYFFGFCRAFHCLLFLFFVLL